MKLQNKVVWITGASSGIGAACAEAFCAEGAKVIISARREELLHAVRDRCVAPERVTVCPMDVTDHDRHATLVDSLEASVGPIDVLINNAGVSQRARAEETTLEVDRRIMELNYFAVVSLTKAALPSMVARKTGHLVVVSSVAGYVGTKRRTAYAATKHAVRGYFDSLRAEVAEHGVGVTIVCPGYVQTEISSSAMLGDGGTSGSTDANIARGIPADQAARAILRGVLRGQHEVYVGGKEIAAIYLKRFFPRLLARIVRKMPEV